MSEQELFTQKGAAKYLGVSVRFFRDNIHVEPIPVAGGSLLRYRRSELDALIAEWTKRRSA